MRYRLYVFMFDWSIRFDQNDGERAIKTSEEVVVWTEYIQSRCAAHSSASFLCAKCSAALWCPLVLRWSLASNFRRTRRAPLRRREKSTRCRSRYLTSSQPFNFIVDTWLYDLEKMLGGKRREISALGDILLSSHRSFSICTCEITSALSSSVACFYRTTL